MKKTSQEVDKSSKETRYFKRVNSLEEFIIGDFISASNAKENKEQCFEGLNSLRSSDEFDIDVIDLKENTLLHYAIIENKPILAKALLQRQDLKKLLEHKNIDGMVPLYLAVYHKNWVLAQQLIDRGADVNATAKSPENIAYGTSILWWAVHHRQWELAKKLIEKKANINAKVESEHSLHYGTSILWWAVRCGGWDLAQQLIERGADANATAKSPNSSHYGTSILWWVVGCRKWKLAQQLIERGADVNATAKSPNNIHYGTSILWWAVYHQEWSIAQQLIANKADVNATIESPNSTHYGISILWWVVRYQQWDLAQQLIIDKEADINAKAGSPNSIHYGISILWWGIHYQQWDLVKELIKRKADVNAKPELEESEDYGKSILWWAVHYQHWALVRQLIHRGALVDVNVEPKNKIAVLQALTDDMQWKSYYDLIKKIDIYYLQTLKVFNESNNSCYPNLEKLLFHKPEVIKEELDRFSPFKCDVSQKNIGSIIELIRVSLYILQGKQLKDNKNKKLDNKEDVLARIHALPKFLRIKIVARYLHAVLQDFDCFQEEGAKIRASLVKEMKDFLLNDERANNLITYSYEQENKKVIEDKQVDASGQEEHIDCINDPHP